MTPARTSRPMASDPSGNPGRSPGQRNGRVTSAHGSPRWSRGPPIAVPATAANSASPSSAARFARYRRQSPGAIVSSPDRDPRVEPRVEEIHDDVSGDHQARRQEQDAQQQIDVPLEDRLEGQTAEPRPGEYDLNHDGTAQQRSDLDTEHRDH